MKQFPIFLLCCVVAWGGLSGCASAGPGSAADYQTAPATSLNGIEQKPHAENAGWADSLGWIFLKSLYATAVANQSN